MDNNEFSENGLYIQTVIKGKIYIVRGYKEGEGFPDDYVFVMNLICYEDRLEAVAYLSRNGEAMTIKQFRALRKFAKEIGFNKYTYERSDGEQLTIRERTL